MSRSTFSGPVQAGVDDAIFYEKGTTGAKIGANWGFLKMAQSCAIEQAGGQVTTDIIIPQNSTIVRITLLVTTAWNATTTIDVGTAWGPYPGPGVDLTEASEYDYDELANGWVAVGAVGLKRVEEGNTDPLDASEVDNWMSLPREGVQSDRIIITQAWAGTEVGRGVLTVEYCQAVNLEAIPA